MERDAYGYSILAEWMCEDAVDAPTMRWLGDAAAERFGADEIWTRTFAPLLLDVIVSDGTYDARWQEAFERWYATETDLRGHDPELGWLHAVAHGGDLLGTFGLSPFVEPTAMLDLAARRLSAPHDAVWRDGEDERLGFGIGLTLTRPELTAEQSVAWLEPLLAAWAAVPRGEPTPAWVSNGSRTLRVVLGLALTGARPSGEDDVRPFAHPDAVRDGLLAALHARTPWMW